MKEELIKRLALDAKASEAEIIAAVATLQETVATLQDAVARKTAVTKREEKIQGLIVKTGMQRADAEHVIDQQAREDAARKTSKKSKNK